MKAILSKKDVAAFTGGFVAWKVGQCHIGESNSEIVIKLLSACDADTLSNPDKWRQCCYAACGAIIQHERNCKLYRIAMG